MRRAPVSGAELRPYRLAYMGLTNEICVTGDPELVQQLLHWPGARYSGQVFSNGNLRWNDGAYLAIPADRTAFMAVESLASPETVGDEYRHARNWYMQLDLSEIYQQWEDFGIALGRTLLPHQVEFCAFAMGRRGAFNASEQGTGKTTTGWIMMHAWRSRRILVVCPKSLINEWMGDYDKLFFVEPPVEPVPLRDGSVRSRGTTIASYNQHHRPVAVLINYEVLERLEHAVSVFNPDTVIFDESWRIKSPSAAVTQTALRIADNCEHVLLLTGTAIGNDVGDLYTQLRAIDPRIQTFGRTLRQCHGDFLQRYGQFITIEMGRGSPIHRQMPKCIGCADPPGLMQRISPYWYRATKATCLNIPPKQFHPPVRLELPEEIAQLYREVDEHGESALGAEMSLSDRRVVMLRMHQIAGGHIPTPVPLMGNLAPEEEVDDLAELLRSMAYRWEQEPIEPWPKLEWLKQFAVDRLYGDPYVRVIVWARYNKEVDRITAALREILGQHRVAGITGATKERQLDAFKESFNSRHRDGYQVGVFQIKKMAFGHNLQAGDIHVRYSRDWSYIYESQSEDRSHRSGRDRAVDYYELQMRGTIDEDISRVLARRQNVATLVSPDTVGHRRNS